MKDLIFSMLLFISGAFSGPLIVSSYSGNTDVLHYEFSLSLSDSTDQIYGRAALI